MKKKICAAMLFCLLFVSAPAFADCDHHYHRHHHGHYHHGHMYRPYYHHHHTVVVRPRYYRPVVRPYYYSSYNYYPAMPYDYNYNYAPTTVVGSGVVAGDPYVGVNTAANVINAAANVATAVRLLTW